VFAKEELTIPLACVVRMVPFAARIAKISLPSKTLLLQLLGKNPTPCNSEDGQHQPEGAIMPREKRHNKKQKAAACVNGSRSTRT
jgi:hypothetical protein